jgi:S-adenosylmethionine:tRNA ribosyltransferase-isomerase
MNLSEFDFVLPPEAIAQRPARPRDAARLLEVGRTFVDRDVGSLPSLLEAGDVIVLNDTRVIPARLVGHRGMVTIELTLLEELAPGRWRALAKRARRLRPGHRLDFAPDFSAEVAAKGEGGEVTLAFDRAGGELEAALESFGTAPLPPYIRRREPFDGDDLEDYQTVYARKPGAVAAPTAGLHFTEALLAKLEARGVHRTMVTLHVGAGTFLPVKTESIADHVLHRERGEIDAAAAEVVNDARSSGKRIVAVGTTTLRLLETAAAADGRLKPFAGDTSLFITPGYQFRTAELLLTNFHLPRSTLFMLVCAFAGTARMREAYAHAVNAGYRFYSYGDCCLLHRADRT